MHTQILLGKTLFACGLRVRSVHHGLNLDDVRIHNSNCCWQDYECVLYLVASQKLSQLMFELQLAAAIHRHNRPVTVNLG